MDKKVSDLLRAYEERSKREWALMDRLSEADARSDIDDFLLSVGPHTGEFLHMLVEDAKSTRILEIGTSYGYSTTWLADAARMTGGRVTTIELQAKKRDHARQQLEGVGLAGHVEFQLGDALAILAKLDGPYDFVLLDLWKNLYVGCFDRFLPKLAPGALVVADNMIYPPDTHAQTMAYQRRLRDTGRFESVLLPIGSGLEVSRLIA
ncbi:MAG TPA: class I SAM-dependent methyltransferase [Steroidobacteraceae bacterium]|nr:class I SAM-dependent methyltransferase [Steroidobacteraceae bacterium]